MKMSGGCATPGGIKRVAGIIQKKDHRLNTKDREEKRQMEAWG